MLMPLFSYESHCGALPNQGLPLKNTASPGLNIRLGLGPVGSSTMPSRQKKKKEMFGFSRAIRCACCGEQFGTVRINPLQLAPLNIATFGVFVQGMSVLLL